MSKEYLKEFEEALDAVVAPVLKDDEDDLDTMDLDLDDVGSELDADDDEHGGFSQKPMYDQLGKVLDSAGNPKPVDTVTTDDGKQHKVTPDQARILRMLATTDKVKPIVRDKFTKDIQTSNGLADFLDIKDYHEITHLFVKRYLG
jgi:hypothetical protein